MTETSYKDAGVDLEKYQQAMARLPGLLSRTHRPGVMEMPGGFAGLFRLADAGTYQDPVMVSGSDGVGTKVKVAITAGRFESIGIDLVAMCANDIACLGAEPLFFLDYLALGKDNPDLISKLVEGVSEGCVQAKSALLGGETAIMPDLYADGDFDMAGFCVGVVERDEILDGPKRIKPGDCIVGIASSGFHSNGYSLIRKVVFEKAGLGINDRIEELDSTVADALLVPTTIYTQFVTKMMAELPAGSVSSIAHITGGGLEENIERVLPESGSRACIDRTSWTVPPAFGWLDELGGIGTDEMFRVFNMGVGMCVIASAESVEQIVRLAAEFGNEAWKIGEIRAGEKGVELSN